VACEIPEAAEESEVIIDTSAVFKMKGVLAALKPGEIPVITRTTMAELRAIVARGKLKMPGIVASLKVVDDSVAPDTAIQIRSLVLGEKRSVPGLLCAGKIGATALGTNRSPVTRHRDLADAERAMAGDARYVGQ
jgi:hypothetical protein